MDNNYTNVISSEVMVVGAKRISFENKQGELIEGVKVFYTHNIKENDYNKNDIYGREIDPNNYSCFIKDIERWNELTYQLPGYKARLEQEFVSTNRALKFIDLKIID